MGSSKKQKKHEKDPLISLAKGIMEKLEAQNLKNLEVFDMYTHALRKKICTDVQHFPARFLKGYEVLKRHVGK